MTEYKDKIGRKPAYTIDERAYKAMRDVLPEQENVLHARETVARDEWEKRVSRLPARVARLYEEREWNLDHIRHLQGMFCGRFIPAPEHKDALPGWRIAEPTNLTRKVAKEYLRKDYGELYYLDYRISLYWEKCEKEKSAKSA